MPMGDCHERQDGWMGKEELIQTACYHKITQQRAHKSTIVRYRYLYLGQLNRIHTTCINQFVFEILRKIKAKNFQAHGRVYFAGSYFREFESIHEI